jgi:hypothetical protein
MLDEPEDSQEENSSDSGPGSDRNVLLIAAGILLVLVAAFGIYYYAIYKKPAKSREAGQASAAVEEKQLPPAEVSQVTPAPAVELDKSDDLVRRLARELSSHPRLGAWLRSEQLIRHFVGAIDNIANGLSPRHHIIFFLPDGPYKVVKSGNVLIADPDGYARYHPVVDVFVSMDSRECVSLFRGLKPLCQEAYRDLGYPNQDFEATVVRAIRELLATPVVGGDIILEKAVVNYTMLDPNLENLSDAQKHFLRMGPENVEAIQTKLREMAMALGVPASSLPAPKHYST